MDPFPSVTSSYLGLRRAFGDERVGHTEMVVPRPEDKNKFVTARNAYLSMLESRVLMNSLPLNVVERARVDLTKTDKDLQYYVPEVQKRIDEWKEEARTKLDAQMGELVAAARRLVGSVADSLIREADATVEYQGSEMKHVILATEVREAALKKRDELLAKLRD